MKIAELVELFYEGNKRLMSACNQWLRNANEEEKRKKLIDMYKQVKKRNTNPICGCVSEGGHLIYKHDCMTCNPKAAIASLNRKNTNRILNKPNTPEEDFIIDNICVAAMIEMDIYNGYYDSPIPVDRVEEFEKKCFPLLKRELSNYKVYNKLDHTFKGCTAQFLRWNIQRQLEDTWYIGQYRKNIWDLDHIIPCDKVDLQNPEDIKKVFHWNNIRPLLAKENKKKSNK